MRALMLAALALTACAPKSPRVTYAELQSPSNERPLAYSVYTPPGWDGSTALPLVVFLHGGGDDETAWGKHPIVTKRLDDAIEAGWVPPFVAVIPDGERGFWRDWADGTNHYETWVMDEVVPHMEASYNLLPGAENRHMMGISMGGAGTLYMGLDHLDRFASLSVFSAPIFTAEETQRFLEGGFAPANLAPMDRVFGEQTPEQIAQATAYAQLQSAADLHGTRFLVGYGTVDIPGIPKANQRFHDHLVEAGVPHHYVVYDGGHVYSGWSKAFPVALCLQLDPEGCTLPERGPTVQTYRPGTTALAER